MHPDRRTSRSLDLKVGIPRATWKNVTVGLSFCVYVEGIMGSSMFWWLNCEMLCIKIDNLKTRPKKSILKARHTLSGRPALPEKERITLRNGSVLFGMPDFPGAKGRCDP